MAYSRLTHLGDIPVAHFLKAYWQKKPLLVRQVFKDFCNPISAEDLAGFSLEEDVVSRIIIEKRKSGESHWQTEHGPFTEKFYSQLPSSHWTLLVQHVDALNSNIRSLLEAFRFLPRWRLEDVMVSYASDQGSAGPHFDYYDVFLLQAEGERRWKLGQRCSSETTLKPALDTKILAEFQCEEDWVLQAGDMLYIPPGVAHWGIAQGDNCMTFSIGFRAPSHSDILLDYFTEVASRLNEDQRYSDAGLMLQANSGEISLSAIDKLKNMLHQYAADTEGLSRWFGEYMTRPLHEDAEIELDDSREIELSATELKHGVSLVLMANLRMAFFREKEFARLFVAGESWRCSIFLAEALDSKNALDFQKCNKQDKNVLLALAERGFLARDKR